MKTEVLLIYLPFNNGTLFASCQSCVKVKAAVFFIRPCPSNLVRDHVGKWQLYLYLFRYWKTHTDRRGEKPAVLTMYACLPSYEKMNISFISLCNLNISLWHAKRSSADNKSYRISQILLSISDKNLWTVRPYTTPGQSQCDAVESESYKFCQAPQFDWWNLSSSKCNPYCCTVSDYARHLDPPDGPAPKHSLSSNWETNMLVREMYMRSGSAILTSAEVSA